MSRELCTSWSEYQAGIDRLLALAQREIRIYDWNLAELRLDSMARIECMKSVLRACQPNALRIALRDTGSLQRDHPRLMHLLSEYAHGMTIQQTPEHLGGLRDSMILIDSHHGLIRFDQEHPRSKLLIDESQELLPYMRRFEQIWDEGGLPVSATTLGL